VFGLDKYSGLGGRNQFAADFREDRITIWEQLGNIQPYWFASKVRNAVAHGQFTYEPAPRLAPNVHHPQDQGNIIMYNNVEMLPRNITQGIVHDPPRPNGRVIFTDFKLTMPSRDFYRLMATALKTFIDQACPGYTTLRAMLDYDPSGAPPLPPQQPAGPAGPVRPVAH
jgi:hypothetical protein